MQRLRPLSPKKKLFDTRRNLSRGPDGGHVWPKELLQSLCTVFLDNEAVKSALIKGPACPESNQTLLENFLFWTCWPCAPCDKRLGPLLTSRKIFLVHMFNMCACVHVWWLVGNFGSATRFFQLLLALQLSAWPASCLTTRH